MSNSNHLVTLTDENFQDTVRNATQPVLVDFWAAWCGPCRLVSPIVNSIADQFAGRVHVGKLNIDDYPHIASSFGISAIPTLLIFHNGAVVDQLIGVVPEVDIAARLTQVLSTAAVAAPQAA